MPNISFFYGILITMFFEDHNPPHFHAKYQDNEAVFDFEGNILKGSFPEKQTRMVQAWTVIHQEDLLTNWNLLLKKDSPEKIEPLR